MNFPKSEFLGVRRAPDGRDYSLDFYGENEGAAVVSGPRSYNGKIEAVPEVHREPASNASEARAKLEQWCRAQGWT